MNRAIPSIIFDVALLVMIGCYAVAPSSMTYDTMSVAVIFIWSVSLLIMFMILVNDFDDPEKRRRFLDNVTIDGTWWKVYDVASDVCMFLLLLYVGHPRCAAFYLITKCILMTYKIQLQRREKEER